MSEKRFVVKELNFEDTVIEDTVTKERYNEYGVVDLLNEQQATIEEQNKQIEEWEFSFRTEMAHHRVAEKELQDKIREQQAIIEAKDSLLSILSKENEELRKENKDLNDIEWEKFKKKYHLE